MLTRTMIEPITPVAPAPRIHRFWPLFMIVCGIGVTVAWNAFLAYGVFALVRRVI